VQAVQTEPSRPLKPLLSAADVMALFSRSDRTIRRYVERGHLASVQIGRALFFREEDVRALIAKGLSRRVLARSQAQVGDPAAPADTPGDDPSK
jgi:predicted DNA-binding transcriptional regulator AlpA